MANYRVNRLVLASLVLLCGCNHKQITCNQRPVYAEPLDFSLNGSKDCFIEFLSSITYEIVDVETGEAAPYCDAYVIHSVVSASLYPNGELRDPATYRHLSYGAGDFIVSLPEADESISFSYFALPESVALENGKQLQPKSVLPEPKKWWVPRPFIAFYFPEVIGGHGTQIEEERFHLEPSLFQGENTLYLLLKYEKPDIGQGYCLYFIDA